MSGQSFVPTIVLMHQWHGAILQHGNLPPGAIARLVLQIYAHFSHGLRCVGVKESGGTLLVEQAPQAMYTRHALFC